MYFKYSLRFKAISEPSDLLHQGGFNFWGFMGMVGTYCSVASAFFFEKKPISLNAGVGEKIIPVNLIQKSFIKL